MAAARRFASRWRVVPIGVFQFGVVIPSDSDSSRSVSRTKWFMFRSSASYSPRALGLAGHKKVNLPNIVKAGDPVLYQRAHEVDHSEMKSERVQKIIDEMILVMRKAPGGVGLAAPPPKLESL